MQAHEGESILSYLLSVHALEKTKPPSGGSQDVFITPVTNKQNKQTSRTLSQRSRSKIVCNHIHISIVTFNLVDPQFAQVKDLSRGV